MMFSAPKKNQFNVFREIVRFFELLFHTTVRNVRRESVNPIIAILYQVMTSIILIVVFIFFIRVLGTRTIAIRGNEIQFVMVGVQLFMVHNAAMGAVAGGLNVRDPMTLHTHITHFLLIMAAGFSTLYIQILAMLIIYPVVHVLIEPIAFQSFKGFCYALFLSWGTGIGLGYVIGGLQPYAPRIMGLFMIMYARANMIFSGKMLVANSVTAAMLPYFYWNPLFHTIDYSRGSSFINYTPRLTNINYPLTIMIILIVIGFLLQKNARDKVSVSWGTRK